MSVDSGGTATRVLVADLDGAVVATGRGPGANLWSSGTSVDAVIGEAIAATLDSAGPSSIAHGVIAVAAGTGTDPDAAVGIEQSWEALGLSGTPSIVPDMLASYAAGTTASDGVVLGAGTGAVSARVFNWKMAGRAGDTDGWSETKDLRSGSGSRPCERRSELSTGGGLPLSSLRPSQKTRVYKESMDRGHPVRSSIPSTRIHPRDSGNSLRSSSRGAGRGTS